MIYTSFQEIPFHSSSPERLRQIYAVLYFMKHGYDPTDAIRKAKNRFPTVKDYQTIQDKCTRQFAGNMETFVAWYHSGEMLSRLVETNRLDAHDSQIFTELLSCRHPGGPTYNNRQKPAIICHLSDYAADVDTAFEIVLEEIESAIENLNHDGAKAFESSDYDLVQTLRQAGHRMTEFRDKVYALQKEWNSSFISERTQFSKSERQSKRTQKLSQGLRTREDELRIPILRALTKLGGAAASVDVLREVRESMKSALNEYDLATLPSSGMLRWENAAHWARYEMVKDGLLASGSPRGVWELTPKGKSWLAYQNGNINL